MTVIPLAIEQYYGMLIICFTMTFFGGYYLGIYHMNKDRNAPVEDGTIYKCCDHCYGPDGEFSHGPSMIDNHTVPCNEQVVYQSGFLGNCQQNSDGKLGKRNRLTPE